MRRHLAAALIAAFAFVSVASAQLAGGLMFPGPGTPSASGLGLQVNLSGFWSFETTGWTDDTGNGTTLTATGTVISSGTGQVSVNTGNYSGYNGSSYLSVASNTNISSGGGSFSIACWIFPQSALGDEFFFNKGNTGFANHEWGFGTVFTTGNKWSFLVSNTGGNLFRATGATTMSFGAWTLVTGTYDSATKVANLYVNNAFDGTATLTGTLNSTAGNLRVGADTTLSPVANGTRVDQCGFWKGRVLSAGDVTLLYNSGNGLSYIQMNWLLERDVLPSANDNNPVGLARAA